MLLVEKLNYELNGRSLLKDVSFHMRKGEMLAILGANGAGKSTLLKVISGQYQASSGLIYLNHQLIDEFNIHSLSKCRAMLSQEFDLSLNFSVKEIVMMGRYPHFQSKPKKEDYTIVDEIMALCGVDQLAKRSYLQLSGGEKQRVQLARVLSQIWDCPNGLLMLDEPTAALDIQYQHRTLAIAKAMSRKGFMVLFIVHDVNSAVQYADRLLLLKNGRKLFDGPAYEVITRQHIYTIFSVEAQVSISSKTLKPFVVFDEMEVLLP